jgi:RNA polymerase sigma-70 factor (ECF subfamily)
MIIERTESAEAGAAAGFEVEKLMDEPEIDSGAVAFDSDAEAFNSFLAGNDGAFRALYDSYERQLYLYVLRLVGSASDAEDVFQEVWIRMHRMRGDLTPVRKFSALLYTVARNLSINALRDRKKRPDVSMDYLMEHPDAPGAELMSSRRDAEGSDLRDMIERALMQLPVVQREAFILREYFGYSYQEIAGIMSTPMVTAKTRAWRGRERLRKMISAWTELKNSNEK